jgi:hypothetical protein
LRHQRVKNLDLPSLLRVWVQNRAFSNARELVIDLTTSCIVSFLRCRRGRTALVEGSSGAASLGGSFLDSVVVASTSISSACGCVPFSLLMIVF